MNDAELRLQHDRARERHRDRQRAKGLRHAAAAISADLPGPSLQRDAATSLARWALSIADRLDP